MSQPIPAPAIERAILEQIAFLQAYLEQLRADRLRDAGDTIDDPMMQALRDPRFVRWQLAKQLERPV